MSRGLLRLPVHCQCTVCTNRGHSRVFSRTGNRVLMDSKRRAKCRTELDRTADHARVSAAAFARPAKKPPRRGAVFSERALTRLPIPLIY